MGRVYVCDVCKRPTARIEEKLLITPTPSHGRSMHSNYTHHADVGICCVGRIKNFINFKPRRTRAQYNEERKKRSGFKSEVVSADGNSVEKGKAPQKRASRAKAGKAS